MFVMMNFEPGYESPRSEIEKILLECDDTIYFDGDINIFKFSYDDGQEICISPDRLIDIL